MQIGTAPYSCSFSLVCALWAGARGARRSGAWQSARHMSSTRRVVSRDRHVGHLQTPWFVELQIQIEAASASRAHVCSVLPTTAVLGPEIFVREITRWSSAQVIICSGVSRPSTKTAEWCPSQAWARHPLSMVFFAGQGTAGGPPSTSPYLHLWWIGPTLSFSSLRTRCVRYGHWPSELVWILSLSDSPPSPTPFRIDFYLPQFSLEPATDSCLDWVRWMPAGSLG